MAPDFDPLTCDFLRVWRYQHDVEERGEGAWDDDCDCGAPPEAHHIERCSITPIYAVLVGELGSVRAITDEIYRHAARYVRTW